MDTLMNLMNVYCPSNKDLEQAVVYTSTLQSYFTVNYKLWHEEECPNDHRCAHRAQMD